MLRKHLGPDLTELKQACTAMLTSTQIASKQLVWNPNASDGELIPCLKDLSGDAMATTTGNTLMWSPHESELKEDRASRLSRSSSNSFLGSKAKDELRASALHLVCNCDEAMTDARVLQVVLPLTLLPSPPSCVPYTLHPVLLQLRTTCAASSP